MLCCIVDLFISIVTCKWVWLVNWIIGIILVEFALSKNKVLMKVDEARDSKFPAFRRNDVKYWSRPRLYFCNYPFLY